MGPRSFPSLNLGTKVAAGRDGRIASETGEGGRNWGPRDPKSLGVISAFSKRNLLELQESFLKEDGEGGRVGVLRFNIGGRSASLPTLKEGCICLFPQSGWIINAPDLLSQQTFRDAWRSP